MSTRAVIGRKTDKGFCGRYHHWDGYPSGLGATLFALWQGHFGQETAKMLKFLLDDHPEGWSSLDSDNFSNSECYCHGGSPQGCEQKITESNASGCGCEWAYVFDGNGKMEVQASICGPGKFEGQKMVGFFGCGDKKATWKTIATVDLAGQEPNWEDMEKV